MYKFTIETEKCKWVCEKAEKESGWIVEMSTKKPEESEKAYASFRLPINWTKTRVFQFIDSIDQNVV
jgi:hypothetical protein